jgi:hypothetical protein
MFVDNESNVSYTTLTWSILSVDVEPMIDYPLHRHHYLTSTNFLPQVSSHSIERHRIVYQWVLKKIGLSDA